MPHFRAALGDNRCHQSEVGLMRDTNRRRRANFVVLLFLAVVSVILGAAAADSQSNKDEPQADLGTFLVAKRELNNPLFGNTVILMLPIKELPVVVGVIVNKPTHVLLRDLFPDSESLAKQDTAAYFGGPVDMDQRCAIFSSKTPPKKATAVFADVYVTFDSDTIAALAEDSHQSSSVRVFLGRSQWDPDQLANEVARGAWYAMDDDADLIFSAHPDLVWRMLVNRFEPWPLV
jgi:putative transcriptional regulator